ncbi:MAG TPA: M15 family metallopeptidase [Gammaproteobacteria bacterium]
MPTALKKLNDAYAARIADIHLELGIPADYAAVRGLPLCEEADQLTDIGFDISQRMRQLTPAAAHAWQAMLKAAQRDGTALLVVSAFRSVGYQRDLIARKLANGENIDAILRIMAAPGHSEHHTGRALDLTAPGLPPLQEAFEDTPSFAWLRQHAAEFGFHLSYPRDNPHGIIYEPWHWAFVRE